jgi:hypothetical protein
MKNIKDLTEQDCIHCRTQEEWVHVLPFVARRFEVGEDTLGIYKDQTVIWKDGTFGNTAFAQRNDYTIHPASDFLTPTVSVLTEVGDCRVIRHNEGCIVIKDDKAMTLSSELINRIKQNI